MQIQSVEYGDLLETIRQRAASDPGVEDVAALIWVAPGEDLAKIVEEVFDTGRSYHDFLEMIRHHRIRFVQVNDGLQAKLAVALAQNYNLPENTPCQAAHAQDVIFFKTEDSLW